MSEFNIESDAIDVQQIMEQIRSRLKEKRNEDYTEEQIRELVNVKLERFLDPKNVRSGMVELYRKRLKEAQSAEAPTLFDFDPESIYRSSRGSLGQVLYRIRKLLNPLLKLFFNPAPIVHALTVQTRINEVLSQMVRTQAEFVEIAALNYEVMNNLVVEMTRLTIDMKNHRMRVESVAGRLDFDERRARALEKVVQYRPSSPASGGAKDENAADKSKRRRRRGRRRSSGMPGATPASSVAGQPADQPSAAPADAGRPASSETAGAQSTPPEPAASGPGSAPEESAPSPDQRNSSSKADSPSDSRESSSDEAAGPTER